MVERKNVCVLVLVLVLVFVYLSCNHWKTGSIRTSRKVIPRTTRNCRLVIRKTLRTKPG